MKAILSRVVAAAAMLLINTQLSICLAQSTAFTYQGRLTSNGAPANGFFDLTFSLWNAAAGPSQLGSTLTNNTVAVSNGVFTVALDFGNEFPGAGRWLEIGVRSNATGAFALLVPRQPVTSAPYAIKALAVDAAGISGPVSAESLSNAWKLTGNSGTAAGTHFLGTTDNQPVDLRVNSLRALRLERDTNSFFGFVIPNVIAGYESNSVLRGVGGATIAGGGGPEWFGPTPPLQVGGAYGTIGGGVGNIAVGSVATIAGGERGFISSNAYNSFIGGGAWNSIDAGDAVISGGRGNNIGSNAFQSTIGGGSGNSVRGYLSVIGGGNANAISANASYSTIPGGNNNVIGTGASYALAAGNGANANHSGAFVWADSSGSSFASTGNNQFLIRAAGGVGIGTASPGAQLEVRTTAANANAIRFGYASAGGSGNLIAGLARVSIATDNMAERLCILQSSGNVGIGLTGPGYQLQLSADSAGKPNGGSWANSSDARVKRNVAPLTNALERLTQLRGVTFEWINPEDHANQHGTQAGFIAQEVEKIFPKWISEVDGAEHDRQLTGNGKIKSLTLPFEFDALIVEALKEQQAQILERDKEIEQLKQRLGALEKIVPQFSRNDAVAARVETGNSR
jgi:hypothetical protein